MIAFFGAKIFTVELPFPHCPPLMAFWGMSSDLPLSIPAFSFFLMIESWEAHFLAGAPTSLSAKVLSPLMVFSQVHVLKGLFPTCPSLS